MQKLKNYVEFIVGGLLEDQADPRFAVTIDENEHRVQVTIVSKRCQRLLVGSERGRTAEAIRRLTIIRAKALGERRKVDVSIPRV